MKMITLSVQTSEDKQMVVLGAQTKVAGDTEDRSYFLAPVQAVEIANSILHSAEECGVEIKMQTLGISDEKRLRLIKRIEMVMRSLSGKKLPYMAAQVVDTILTEVL
jgi:hypothetical protein